MARARGPMKDLKIEESGIGDSQVIEEVVPLNSYLVKYRDNMGKQQVRVALLVPDTDIGVVNQSTIQGSQVFVPMSNWFVSQLREQVNPPKETESV